MAEGAVASADVLQAVLATAFPFGFAFDDDLRLVHSGEGLRRACPTAVVGASVHELVALVAPRLPLTFDMLAAHPEALVLLHLLGVPGGPLPMRGQFVVPVDARCGFFLGAPWVDDAEQLLAAGLTVDDFAVHDAVLDRLFATQAGALARADAARMDALLRDAEQTRRALAAAEQSLARELDAVPDLLLRMTDDGTLLTVRPSAEGDLPRSPAEYVGTDVAEGFPELAAGLRAALRHAPTGGDVVTFEFDEERAGAVRHFEARVARTTAAELLTLVRDVTEQRLMAGRLRHQAQHDPLTGLVNRAVFSSRVADALERHEGDSRACVLFVDLDDFKQVNDVLGHAAGDALLAGVAARMRDVLRPGDVVARLGGDEFAVLLAGVGDAAGAAAAQRLTSSLAAPFPAAGGHPEMRTSASIGVAAAAASDDAGLLLSHADVAMYAAKAAGKGCYSVFETGMREELLARISAEVELEAGVERGELFLDYQPVVRLPSGELVGAEALVRWQHPTRGALLPEDFLPVAEASGLVVTVGGWVLHEACRAATGWGALAVTVGVCGRHLAAPQLVGQVRDALERSGLEPARLTLAVTENALVDGTEQALQTLGALRALGVRLALDRFGTGLASITHLRRVAVDELKLDSSFVAELHDPRQARIAEGVLALAAVLGIAVVAEGVDTQAQADALLAIGCLLVQGDRYGSPGTDELLRSGAACVSP